MLYGEDGADTLFGGTGFDTLYGGNDNDVLYGNEDNDVLYGGDGADTLFGGAGSDILQGGNGNDMFMFDVVNFGSDAITDYIVGNDSIYFNWNGSVAPLPTVSVIGSNIQLAFTGGGILTLNGLATSNNTVNGFVVVDTAGMMVNKQLNWNTGTSTYDWS